MEIQFYLNQLKIEAGECWDQEKTDKFIEEAKELIKTREESPHASTSTMIQLAQDHLNNSLNSPQISL